MSLTFYVRGQGPFRPTGQTSPEGHPIWAESGPGPIETLVLGENGIGPEDIRAKGDRCFRVQATTADEVMDVTDRFVGIRARRTFGSDAKRSNATTWLDEDARFIASNWWGS